MATRGRHQPASKPAAATRAAAAADADDDDDEQEHKEAKGGSGGRDDRDDCEPEKIGDYVFLQTLGQGSFGKVKLAQHVRTKEKVAIKIVSKSTIADVEDVERVYRETFILTTLKHKNIIKLYEVFDTPKAIMLVMEYAGGGELYNYVAQRQRLGEAETCRLFHQIVSGVEYCHRAKVIHRDLKLENILLDKGGNVKIADFGLSNSIKFGQKMDTNCGTPSYTCPEQISNKKYVGSAADIWSMGVILFSMVCGFLPFEAPSIPALFRRIRHRLFKTPDYISKEGADLIDRMLTIDPEKRCTISDLRNHPWFLMEYTELADQIEARAAPTADQIADARAASMAVGDDSTSSHTSSAKQAAKPSTTAGQRAAAAAAAAAIAAANGVAGSTAAADAKLNASSRRPIGSAKPRGRARSVIATSATGLMGTPSTATGAGTTTSTLRPSPPNTSDGRDGATSANSPPSPNTNLTVTEPSSAARTRRSASVFDRLTADTRARATSAAEAKEEKRREQLAMTMANAANGTPTTPSSAASAATTAAAAAAAGKVRKSISISTDMPHGTHGNGETVSGGSRMATRRPSLSATMATGTLGIGGQDSPHDRPPRAERKASLPHGSSYTSGHSSHGAHHVTHSTGGPHTAHPLAPHAPHNTTSSSSSTSTSNGTGLHAPHALSAANTPRLPPASSSSSSTSSSSSNEQYSKPSSSSTRPSDVPQHDPRSAAGRLLAAAAEGVKFPPISPTSSGTGPINIGGVSLPAAPSPTRAHRTAAQTKTGAAATPLTLTGSMALGPPSPPLVNGRRPYELGGPPNSVSSTGNTSSSVGIMTSNQGNGNGGGGGGISSNPYANSLAPSSALIAAAVRRSPSSGASSSSPAQSPQPSPREIAIANNGGGATSGGGYHTPNHGGGGNGSNGSVFDFVSGAPHKFGHNGRAPSIDISASSTPTAHRTPRGSQAPSYLQDTAASQQRRTK